MPVWPLKCSVKNYHWGTKGYSSAVAPFIKQMGDEVDNSQTYAEVSKERSSCPRVILIVFVALDGYTSIRTINNRSN